MTDRRQAVRGVTLEGRVREAMEFIEARPDIAWPSAWRARCDLVQLPRDLEREVKVQILRLRNFGRGQA